jgi:hypothetical protein
MYRKGLWGQTEAPGRQPDSLSPVGLAPQPARDRDLLKEYAEASWEPPDSHDWQEVAGRAVGLAPQLRVYLLSPRGCTVVFSQSPHSQHRREIAPLLHELHLRVSASPLD